MNYPSGNKLKIFSFLVLASFGFLLTFITNNVSAQAQTVDLRFSATAKANFPIFNAVPTFDISAKKWSYEFQWNRKLSNRNGYILISQLQSDNRYHIVARYPISPSGAPLNSSGSVTTAAIFSPGSSYRISYYSKPYGSHTSDYVILRSLFQAPSAPGQTGTIPTITSPGLNDKWTMGTIRNITWLSGAGVQKVDIGLSRKVNIGTCTGNNCATAWEPFATIASGALNSGSFQWLVGDSSKGSVTAGQYLITITPNSSSGGAATDAFTSSEPFEIVTSNLLSAITITNPPSNQTTPQWIIGSTKTITWSPPAGISNVNLLIQEQVLVDCYGTDPSNCSLPAGGQFAINNIPNSGSYTWTVSSIPNSLDLNSRYVVIISTSNASGMSGGFYIVPPQSTQSGSPRVGQLISLSGTIYYVAQNGLYAVTSTDILNSWGWSNNALTANSAEQALTKLGNIPPRDPACGNPIDQINKICGGLSSSIYENTNYNLITDTNGNGTVSCTIGSASPITPCSSTVSVPAGQQITLSASPNSRFIGWSGNLCNTLSSTCAFTMPSSPVNITANFSASTISAPIRDTLYFKATLTSPVTDGQNHGVLSNSSGTETFQWTTVPGAGPVGRKYWLQVGNSFGQGDISSGETLNDESKTVYGLPTDGRTIYVRLWTHDAKKIDPGDNSTWTDYVDYSFTTVNSNNYNPGAPINPGSSTVGSPTMSLTVNGVSGTYNMRAGDSIKYVWNASGADYVTGSMTGGPDYNVAVYPGGVDYCKNSIYKSGDLWWLDPFMQDHGTVTDPYNMEIPNANNIPVSGTYDSSVYIGSLGPNQAATNEVNGKLSQNDLNHCPVSRTYTLTMTAVKSGSSNSTATVTIKVPAGTPIVNLWYPAEVGDQSIINLGHHNWVVVAPGTQSTIPVYVTSEISNINPAVSVTSASMGGQSSVIPETNGFVAYQLPAQYETFSPAGSLNWVSKNNVYVAQVGTIRINIPLSTRMPVWFKLTTTVNGESKDTFVYVFDPQDEPGGTVLP